MTTHWAFKGTTITCAQRASTTRRERPKQLTSKPAQVTCKRCLKIFAGEMKAARDAQLDAQERDTLQANGSAKRERMMQNAQTALDRVADSMQRNAAQLGATIEKLSQKPEVGQLFMLAGRLQLFRIVRVYEYIGIACVEGHTLDGTQRTAARVVDIELQDVDAVVARVHQPVDGARTMGEIEIAVLLDAEAKAREPIAALEAAERAAYHAMTSTTVGTWRAASKRLQAAIARVNHLRAALVVLLPQGTTATLVGGRVELSKI